MLRSCSSPSNLSEGIQLKRLRGKLTYSNVMVTVLAFVVLAGGTAYAATEMLPKNSVGTKQLAKEAVTPGQAQQSLESHAHRAEGRDRFYGCHRPAGSEGR